MNSEVDKMHIPSLKRYITMTYKKFGDRQLANYWNLGYINCLMNNKIIDRCVGAGLAGYNDRIYFIEEMKIIERKNKIDCMGYGEWTNFKKGGRQKMIEMGDRVKDTITDFKGTVVAKIIYATGCIRYEVKPRGLKDGKSIEAEWIDESTLVIVEKAKPKATKIVKEKEEPPGGPGDVPSESSHP